MYFMQLQMSECCIHLSINHRFNQYNMFFVVVFFHPTIFFATMGINTVLRGDWEKTYSVSWEHPLSWEEILCCDETLPVFWKETHLVSWEDIYLVSWDGNHPVSWEKTHPLPWEKILYYCGILRIRGDQF